MAWEKLPFSRAVGISYHPKIPPPMPKTWLRLLLNKKSRMGNAQRKTWGKGYNDQPQFLQWNFSAYLWQGTMSCDTMEVALFSYWKQWPRNNSRRYWLQVAINRLDKGLIRRLENPSLNFTPSYFKYEDKSVRVMAIPNYHIQYHVQLNI